MTPSYLQSDGMHYIGHLLNLPTSWLLKAPLKHWGSSPGRREGTKVGEVYPAIAIGGTNSVS